MPKAPRKQASEVAEDTLVGCLMSGVPVSVVEEHVAWADFAQPAMMTAYRSAHSLYINGVRPTPESVVSEATKLGLVPMDVDTLVALAKSKRELSELDAANVAKEVRRYAYLRHVETVCNEAIREARSGRIGAAELSDSIQGKLVQVSGSADAAADFRDEAILEANRQVRNFGKDSIPGFTTGIAGVDDASLGLCPGDNWVIAARPGVGKTAFATNVGMSVADLGGGVLMFSAEMQAGQLVQRIMSSKAGIDSRKLRRNAISKDELSKLLGAAESFPGNVFKIVDRNIGPNSIRSVARRTKAQMEKKGIKLRLVILDYLQLVAKYGQSREQSVAEVSWSMKTLAKELECTSFTISQLNRGGESADDKRPHLHHLRDSGSIEQDADFVAMLYRDCMYNNNAPKDVAELIYRKNRNGPIGTLCLGYDGPKTRFYDIGSVME